MPADAGCPPHLHTARLQHVAVVAEAQLTPLVGPEAEEAAGGGGHGRVLVPAGDRHDLVILNPELARRVLRKLGLAECEYGARGRNLRILHQQSPFI